MAAVTIYDPSEYANMRLFLTEDGMAGAALNGDEAVSLFKHPDAPHQAWGSYSLRLAVEQGARRLDAFDTVLPHIYAEQGFRPVGRVRWVDEFAPEGWNYNTFKEWNDGRPDVVAMVYDPNAPRRYAPDLAMDFGTDYDAMVAYAQQQVRRDEYLFGTGGLLEHYGTGRQVATRTGLGFAGGAGFGAAVSPEGERLEGALRGGIAGMAIPHAPGLFRTIRTGATPTALGAFPEIRPSLFGKVREGAVSRAQDYFVPEQVESAIIRFGDEVFEGHSHFDALEKAMQKYGEEIDFDAINLEAFRTNRQNIISRDDALERFGGYTSDKLLPKTEGQGAIRGLFRQVGIPFLGGTALVADQLQGEDADQAVSAALQAFGGLLLIGKPSPLLKSRAGRQALSQLTERTRYYTQAYGAETFRAGGRGYEVAGSGALVRTIGDKLYLATQNLLRDPAAYGAALILRGEGLSDAAIDAGLAQQFGRRLDPGDIPAAREAAKEFWNRTINQLVEHDVPDPSKIRQWLEAGDPEWYQKSGARALTDLVGDSNGRLLGQILAGLSGQTGVTQNVEKAVRAWKQIMLGLPLTNFDRGDLRQIARALNRWSLGGPKVGAFGRNIAGDLSAMAIDRHMKMAAGFAPRTQDENVVGAVIHEFWRQNADAFDIEPAAFQAGVWGGYRGERALDPKFRGQLEAADRFKNFGEGIRTTLEEDPLFAATARAATPEEATAEVSRVGLGQRLKDFTEQTLAEEEAYSGTAGFARREAVAALTGGAIGATGGAAAGEEEGRIGRMIAGGLAGAGAALGLDRFAARIAREAASEARVPDPEDFISRMKEEGVPEPIPERRPGAPEYETEELFGETARWGEEEPIVREQMEEAGARFETGFKEPQTWAQQRREARALGFDPDVMDIEGMTRKQMYNLKDETKTNAKKIRDIDMQLQGRDPADPGKVAEDLLPSERKTLEAEAKRLEEENIRLFGKYMKVRTEFGRSLQSMKAMAEFTRLPNGRPDPSYWTAKARRIADESGYGDLTDEVVEEIRRLAEAGEEDELIRTVSMLRQANIGKQVATLWKAGLLTSPVTHLRNLIGNTTMMTLEAMKERPAYLLDRMFSTMTGVRTVGAPGHGGTWAGFKGGMGEVSDVMKGKIQGDLKKVDQVMEIDINFPFWPKVKKGGREVNWFLDTYQKSVYRALAAGDRPFRKAGLNRSMREQANLMAEQNPGTTAAYWLLNPTDEMTLRAIADSETAIFVNKGLLGDIGSGLKRTAHRYGPVPGASAELFMPFTATPANIISRVVEYTGLGYIGMIYDLARAVGMKSGMVKPGSFIGGYGLADAAAAQRRAAQRGGRATVGMTAILAGYLAHRAGYTTGEYPESPTARAIWRETGKISHAVQFPGADRWRSIESIAPLGNLFNFGAEISEALQAQEDVIKAGTHAVMGIPRMAVDQSFLRGVQQTLEFITAGQTGLGEYTSEQYMQNLGSSVVPNIFRATARAIDPVMRERQIEDAPLANLRGGFTASFPFLSRTMPPKLDALGYERSRFHDAGPINRMGYAVSQFISPFSASPDLAQRYPISAEMERLGWAPQRLQRMREYGETMDEYQERAAKVGEEIETALTELMAKPSYLNDSLEDQLEKFQKAVSDARAKINKPFRDRYKERNQPPQ